MKTYCNYVVLLLIAIYCICNTQSTSAQNSKAKSDDILIHYWHFNSLGEDIIADVIPDYSLFGNAKIAYQGFGGGYMDRVFDGTDLNAVTGYEESYALRVRNPSNLRDLVFYLPSNGFANLNLSYAVKRTANGQQFHTVYYSTTNIPQWNLLQSNIEITEDYQIVNLNFSDIEMANNNQDFLVKIIFGGDGLSGTSGNNRFDNVKFSGQALEEINTSPYFTELLSFIPLIHESIFEINLDELVIDPDGDQLEFTAVTSTDGFIDLIIQDNILKIIPKNRGAGEISIIASDGVNSPIGISFNVIIYPKSKQILHNEFSFTSWGANMTDYEYPDYMIFLQSDREDPNLNYELLFPYFIPYDDYHEDDQGNIGFPYSNTRRTRINALGENGISFINTGRDRDLGGALVAINTEGLNKVFVSFKTGTLIQNERLYAIRLMYRIGVEGEFLEVLSNGVPVDYTVSYSGHFAYFNDIELPEEILDEDYVQLLWKYYYLEGQSGPRPEMLLDDIYVRKNLTNLELTQNTRIISVYPNPAKEFIIIDTEENINFDILNIDGQIVLSSNEKIIDVSGLVKGMYIMYFRSSSRENIAVQKLIIE